MTIIEGVLASGIEHAISLTMLHCEEPLVPVAIIAALDGQRVRRGNRSKTVRVLGVHAHGHEHWVQVGFSTSSRDDVVLRLSCRNALARAMDALRATFQPDAHTCVIDLRPRPC